MSVFTQKAGIFFAHQQSICKRLIKTNDHTFKLTETLCLHGSNICSSSHVPNK